MFFADDSIKDELVAYRESEFPLASACGLKERLQIGFSHIIDGSRNHHHLMKKENSIRNIIFNTKCCL